MLSIQGKAPTGPEHLLTELLDRLPANPSLWATLRSRFEVRSGLGLFQGTWNRGFDLSPALLRRVVDVGLGLDFDIYAVGDDEGR